mgnify:CR=1 FL=1
MAIAAVSLLRAAPSNDTSFSKPNTPRPHSRIPPDLGGFSGVAALFMRNAQRLVPKGGKRLTPSQQLWLLAIVEADSLGAPAPSVREQMERLGVGDRAVRYISTQLQALGLVEVSESAFGRNTYNLGRLYTLLETFQSSQVEA